MIRETTAEGVEPVVGLAVAKPFWEFEVGECFVSSDYPKMVFVRNQSQVLQLTEMGGEPLHLPALATVPTPGYCLPSNRTFVIEIGSQQNVEGDGDA